MNTISRIAASTFLAAVLGLAFVGNSFAAEAMMADPMKQDAMMTDCMKKGKTETNTKKNMKAMAKACKTARGNCARLPHVGDLHGLPSRRN